MASHGMPVKNKAATNGCDEPGCPMMFFCSMCGFVVEGVTTILPPRADLLPKPVVHYVTGNLTAYHSDNWKPPKTC